MFQCFIIKHEGRKGPDSYREHEVTQSVFLWLSFLFGSIWREDLLHKLAIAGYFAISYKKIIIAVNRLPLNGFGKTDKQYIWNYFILFSTGTWLI